MTGPELVSHEIITFMGKTSHVAAEVEAACADKMLAIVSNRFHGLWVMSLGHVFMVHVRLWRVVAGSMFMVGVGVVRRLRMSGVRSTMEGCVVLGGWKRLV
jgi:hypothetical protein